MHEVRAFRERKIRSVWFRELVEICVVYGDRGYRGCEGVIVCDSREISVYEVKPYIKPVRKKEKLEAIFNQ